MHIDESSFLSMADESFLSRCRCPMTPEEEWRRVLVARLQRELLRRPPPGFPGMAAKLFEDGLYGPNTDKAYRNRPDIFLGPQLALIVAKTVETWLPTA